MVRLIALVCALTLGVAACAGASAPTPQIIYVTPTPSATQAPLAGGSANPSPSQSLTSLDVVRAFVAAGLEAADPSVMTVKDFGLAPKRTDDATRFLIPSLGPDSGGRAFVFATVEDLRATKAYYDSLGTTSAAFFSWTFANEPVLVLVQINGQLSEAKAAKYKTVVNGLR